MKAGYARNIALPVRRYYVANVCGLLNTTWLIAVEGPSVPKEQMPTNHKVQRAHLHVPNIGGIE